MKKLPVFFGLVLAAGLASTSSAAFNNGDFETGDFTGWDVGFTSNGTTAYQAVEMFDLGYGSSYAAAFAVGQVTFDPGKQEGVLLTQDMYLTAGTTYDLGFHAAAYRPSGGTNLEGGVFALIVDGTILASWASGQISGGNPPLLGSVDGQYTPAVSGTYTVGAMITRPYTIPGDTIYQYVDDFYAVPAPGALALLGLAGLMSRRRR